MNPSDELRVVETVDDGELLALLAPVCTRQEWDVVLRSHGGIRGLLVTDDERLQQALPGKVILQLRAAAEFARRASLGGDSRPKLTTPAAIQEYLRPQLALIPSRRLVLLALDEGGTLLRQETISDDADVEVRRILTPALVAGAVSFILGRHHPMGSAEPNKAELELAKSTKEAAGHVGLVMVDFVIIGAEAAFVSLRARKLLRAAACLRWCTAGERLWPI